MQKILSHENFYLRKSNKKGFQFLWPRGLIFWYFFSQTIASIKVMWSRFFSNFFFSSIFRLWFIFRWMFLASSLHPLESVEKLSSLRVQLVRCKLSHSDDFGAGPTPENLESASAPSWWTLHVTFPCRVWIHLLNKSLFSPLNAQCAKIKQMVQKLIFKGQI